MIHEQPLVAPVVRLSGEYNLGRPEYVAALQAYYRHTGVIRRQFLTFLIVLLTGIGAIIWLQGLWNEPTLLGILSVFTLGVLVLYAKRLERRAVNASLRTMAVDTAPGVTGTRRVQVTDEELLTESSVTRLACRLDVLTTLRADEQIVVLFPGGMFLPVPSSGNFHRESFAMFCDKLDQLIAAAKAKRGNAERR